MRFDGPVQSSPQSWWSAQASTLILPAGIDAGPHPAAIDNRHAVTLDDTANHRNWNAAYFDGKFGARQCEQQLIILAVGERVLRGGAVAQWDGAQWDLRANARLPADVGEIGCEAV